MPAKAGQRNEYGQVRRLAGKVTIFTEKGWTPYPKGAAELIEFATGHGWKIESDGLPVRTNRHGDLIIAVILYSPRYIVRVPWVCQHTTFRLGPVLGKPHGGPWRDLKSVAAVQRLITENAVTAEQELINHGG